MFINKTLVIIAASHIFGLLWQPYLKDSGVPILWFGTITAVSALLIFLLGRKLHDVESNFSGKSIIFYSALLSAIAFLIGAFYKNIYAAIIFYFVIRIGVWIREPAFSHYMNQQIQSHNRATVLSSLSMIDSLFDIVIFTSTGYITTLGMNYSFMFSAALIIVAITVFRVTDKHIKVEA
jgi:hypothetical protein